jgi:hypothetical protein
VILEKYSTEELQDYQKLMKRFLDGHVPENVTYPERTRLVHGDQVGCHASLTLAVSPGGASDHGAVPLHARRC